MSRPLPKGLTGPICEICGSYIPPKTGSICECGVAVCLFCPSCWDDWMARETWWVKLEDKPKFGENKCLTIPHNHDIINHISANPVTYGASYAEPERDSPQV